MADRFENFVDALGSEHRVLLLGGLAVIAHGLSRPTRDADIWLEPLTSPEVWCEALYAAIAKFKCLKILSLLTREELDPPRLPEVIGNDRVIRVTGLNVDLDIFRIPNNLDEAGFSPIWDRGVPWKGNVRVMDPLDLLLTKLETGRATDQTDVGYLEGLVRSSFSEQMLTASPEQALALFDRYADYAVCEKALSNPHPEVRDMAWDLLHEFAEAGDPFARDLVSARRESPD